MMSGRNLLLLLFCAVALPLSAQVGEQRNTLAVGVNAGLNMNSMSFSPSIKQTQLKGANIGISARYISEIYFGMTCGLLAELNYSQHGWSETYEEFPDLKFDRTINYLEIPFLAHLGFGKKAVQFFIHAGPQIGFYLNDNFTRSGDWSVFESMPKQHELEIAHKFDYGLSGGAGLELNSKIGHFLLEGRYYYALSDCFGNEKTDYFSRSAHNVLAVKLTYMMDLWK